MSGRPVATAFADGIALIHLNRPSRLNAVVPELVEALVTALHAAEQSGARAAVIAGYGRAFCSGHDLRTEPEDLDAIKAERRIDRIQDVTRAIRHAPFPVVAAVHGYALGAGCEFALGCDLVVAGEDTVFGFPEVEVGLSVTGGVSRLLPALVGPLRAKELILLGARFTAREAHAMGLVTRLVPAGEHESVALELARTLAAKPRLALALAKRSIDQGLDGTVDDALAREVSAALRTEHSGESDSARSRFAARTEAA